MCVLWGKPIKLGTNKYREELAARYYSPTISSTDGKTQSPPQLAPHWKLKGSPFSRPNLAGRRIISILLLGKSDVLDRFLVKYLHGEGWNACMAHVGQSHFNFPKRAQGGGELGAEP